MFKTLLNHFKATNPDFKDDEFNEVIKRVSIEEYPRKTVLWQQGDRVIKGGFVYKGCFRYFMTNAEGQERTTYFAFEDYWVGDYSSVISGEPASQSVESLEDSILMIMTNSDHKYLLDNCEGFRKFEAIKRTRAYDASLKKIVDLHEPAEIRYQNLINKYPHLINRVPLFHIASYLGITPESLSRLRKKMVDGDSTC